MAGDKVKCSVCRVSFFVPFESEIDAISWATFGSIEKVKRYAVESATHLDSTEWGQAFKRVYELRRWSQKELEQNHIEQAQITKLNLEFEQQEAKNADLSLEVWELRETVSEMIKEKEANELARQKARADKVARQLDRQKLERARLKSEAEAKTTLQWAQQAKWAELDHFMLTGKAKGLRATTVDKLVEIYTNRRWGEEDRIRRATEQNDRKIRRDVIKQIKCDEIREIHEELLAFSIDHVISMSGDEFELFVARLFRAFGYQSEVVGGSLDEGIDVSIWLNDSLFGVVQCKRYADKNISASQIRDFIGAYMATDAKKAFFFTTSRFTKAARETAADFGCLDLYDFSDLKTFVSNARRRIERRQRMVADV